MENLLAGAKTLRPDSWRKAWRLIAGKHLTLENLDNIMGAIVTEAVEGENPKSRQAAQKMVLDIWNKLGDSDIAESKGQPVMALQIVFNEKPKDYLVNVDA